MVYSKKTSATKTPNKSRQSSHSTAQTATQADCVACVLPTNLDIKQHESNNKPVRIYCDGIWDLFHFGHAKVLEQAKKKFPNVHLIAGVCDDESTIKFKGKTVMNETERAESLRHCKWVDEVIEHAPWQITQEFLDQHGIDYVAHDAIPYPTSHIEDTSDDVYAFVKSQGKFLSTKRTEGISTSDLITRVIRDYSSYVKRNLSRGVEPKDLNLSYFQVKQMELADNLRFVSDYLSQSIVHTEGYVLPYLPTPIKRRVSWVYEMLEARNKVQENCRPAEC